MTLKELSSVLDRSSFHFWNQLKMNITEEVMENYEKYLNNRVLALSYGCVTLMTDITDCNILDEYEVDEIKAVNTKENMLHPCVLDVKVKRIAYVTYSDLEDLKS